METIIDGTLHGATELRFTVNREFGANDVTVILYHETKDDIVIDAETMPISEIGSWLETRRDW